MKINKLLLLLILFLQAFTVCGAIGFTNDNTVPTYHYYTQDHLGNNRAVVNDNGTVEQITHYYPFGGTYADVGLNSSLQPYKYNGKELDRMHGLNWYEYGHRQYDPIVPVFTKVDPDCEDYPYISPYAYCLNNPILHIDMDGRSVWTKMAKAAVRVGKRVAKNGLSALNQADTYVSAFSDITDDINTLTNSDATTTERVMAGISLASELAPVSLKDVKDVGRVIKGIKPNNGSAKPHGGNSHNERIDNLIKRLQKDENVTNIRKNQKQVDIDGNVVGNNRPDIQFDKNGVHTNVEYDNRKSSSLKHRQKIENNDPKARNKFYLLNDEKEYEF